MTDLASGAAVGRPARATKRNGVRIALIVVLAVAALAVIGYFTLSTTTAHQSKAASLIRPDVVATYSTRSVSCREVGRIPVLSSRPIVACTISGVARANRPDGHSTDATFTRCYIRTVGDQTVDVSKPVSIISDVNHKLSPCS